MFVTKPIVVTKTEVITIEKPIVITEYKTIEIEKQIIVKEYKDIPKIVFWLLGAQLLINLLTAILHK